MECKLHHYADACEYDYGQVSYLCLVDDNGRSHCSLIICKAYVAPLKVITIPRMELVAATLSVKMSIILTKELEITVNKEVFWADSDAALGYMSRRIDDNDDDNDDKVCNDGKVKKRWHHGPQVLWELEVTWDDNKIIHPINKKGPELKKEFVVSKKAFRCFDCSVKSNIRLI